MIGQTLNIHIKVNKPLDWRRDEMFDKEMMKKRRKERIHNIVQADIELNDKRLEDPEYVWKAKKKLKQNADYSSWHHPFKSKIILSVFIFGLVWIMFQFDQGWAIKSQSFIKKSLTEDFDFNRAANWYDDTFQGSPALISSWNKKGNEAEKVGARLNKSFELPVSATTTSNFNASNRGVYIETHPQEPIRSIDEGRVIYVGRLNDTGLTVIVQHAERLQAIYGFVAETSLQTNDWIKARDQIGIVKLAENDSGRAILFFALKKADDYIDPMEVMTID